MVYLLSTLNKFRESFWCVYCLLWTCFYLLSYIYSFKKCLIPLTRHDKLQKKIKSPEWRFLNIDLSSELILLHIFFRNILYTQCNIENERLKIKCAYEGYAHATDIYKLTKYKKSATQLADFNIPYSTI